MIGVGGVNRAQDIDLHFVPAQRLAAAHDLIEASGAALVDPVGIVHLLRAVHAEADEKVVLLEERAPFIVQEGSVGLHRVQDALPRLPVLLHVLDGALEEVEPHEGRLAALPGDVDLLRRLRLQELPDVGLQHVVGHAEPVARVEHFLGQEEAVLAVQVAYGAGGLGQKVKWPGLANSCRLSYLSRPSLPWLKHTWVGPDFRS